VQVDPLKPILKAPGTKRLKLKYDQLLSNLAFNFNLRRYIKGLELSVDEALAVWRSQFSYGRMADFMREHTYHVRHTYGLEAGAYTRPLSSST